MSLTIKKAILALSTIVMSSSALANDCGWESLTSVEQNDLLSGKSIMRHSLDADGVRSHIDQWAFSKNPSLVESMANFYDISEFKNAGDVADITLADGYHQSNNPVIYNVIPKPGNMFGKLYQPFSMSSRVKADGDSYNMLINYLSSPGLIKHVLNDVTLCTVNEKVLVRFLSTVTDNPKLPISGGVFGWVSRKLLWRKVFLQDMDRAGQPRSETRVENLKTALSVTVE